MAIITFNLSDSIGVTVNSINAMSELIGETSLIPYNDSNVIDGINSLVSILNQFDDSSEVTYITRRGFQAVATGIGNFSYNGGLGKFQFTPPSAAEIRTAIDGAAGLKMVNGELSLNSNSVRDTKFASGSITIDKLINPVTLKTVSSTGAVLLTLRTAE